MITNDMLNPEPLTMEECEAVRTTATEHLREGTTYPMLSSWCAEYRGRLIATINHARRYMDADLEHQAIRSVDVVCELHNRG